MLNRHAVSVTLFLSYAFVAHAVQKPDNALLQQYLSNPAIAAVAAQNPTKLSSMLKDSVALSSSNSPEKKTKDSLAIIKESTNRSITSIYEKLLRQERIEPDSLLATLQVFGHDIFKSDAQISQSGLAPVSNSYPVGPGDEVVITLWGRINEEHRLTVDRNGNINIPRIGFLPVANLSFSGLKEAVMAKVGAIEGVEASVSMGELRSIPIYVVGEVAIPGIYNVSALSNPTAALFACGGPTKMGSLRHIQLLRGSTLIKEIDFYDFLCSGKNDISVRLQPNDVLFVPMVKQMAAVAGNVRRSAIFEIEPASTLSDVIELAGGVSPGGWINRIQIERLQDNQYQTALDISVDSLKKIPDTKILDGDIVKIFPVVNKDENVVFLDGNVLRSGKYELQQGMKLSTLIGGYSNLQPETYFQYAVLERYDPPSYLARIIPFNPGTILADSLSSDNIPLQPRDRVIIYNRDYFEPDRSVTIDGAVTGAGNFKLLDNMRIKDLVLQAGGLSMDASPLRGEVYRRTTDVEAASTKKIDFCVSCAMENDPNHNLTLEKFDRVYIRRMQGWKEQQVVTLVGEVIYSGDYVLLPGETLGQLLARAGGFTDEAYIDAAIFTRQSVKALEQKRLDEYLQQLQRQMLDVSANLAASDNVAEAQALFNRQLALLEQLKQTEAVGRVVINLNKKENYNDFPLEDGDVLYVPKVLNTVSVIGEAVNPSTFSYETDQTRARFYLNVSGGYKPTADKRGCYIIKANGKVVTKAMTSVMKYEMMPGDVLVVPRSIKTRDNYKVFMDTITAIFQITSITAQVFSIISTLSR